MTRWRRPGADEILLVYLVLAAIGFGLTWTSHGFGPQNPLPSFLVMAFLVWRVTRGGRFSRALLVIASGVSYVEAVLAVARLWSLAVVALVIVCAAQVVLILSLPVYARTRRPAPVAVRVRGWAPLLDRPQAWMPVVGMLAGVLLTLACLGHMDYVTIPGCRPAGSGACSALAEGYPLRWLTARGNSPVIFKAALVKDCAQWTLAATSVLYLARLRPNFPARPQDFEVEP